MTKKLFFVIVYLFASIGLSKIGWAQYSRQAAMTYATLWYNTDKVPPGGDGFVDTVNTLAGFTWYRFDGVAFTSPSQQLALMDGADCANFASRCLLSGGVVLNPPMQFTLGRGQGGTIYKVRVLKARLATIATCSLFTAVHNAPAELTMGDVVTWFKPSTGINHTTIVVGGSGPNVTLAAHSADWNNQSLSHYIANGYTQASGYHITGTATIVAMDITPPTIEIFDQQGNPIPPGGNTYSTSVSITVYDGGEGIDGYLASRHHALIDMGDSGNSNYLLQFDDSDFSPSHVYSLSGLPLDTIWIQVYDRAGNVNVRSFTVQQEPPPPDPGPIAGGGGCIKVGECLATPQGAKPIETFRPGDLVLGWNGQAAVPTVVEKVYAHEGTWTLYDVNGTWLTGNHEVFQSGAWQPAAQIGTNSKVFTGRVYDLTTALHNYCGVNQSVLHNYPPYRKPADDGGGMGAAKKTAPSEVFTLGKSYSFPNPAKGVNPTLHLEVGLADDIAFVLFNQAGQEVWSTRVPGHQVIIVDGVYAYEISVDIAHLASGVYLAKMTAKKSGARDLTATVKLAVVK